MFTGIIETAATIKQIVKDNDNIHYTLTSPITHELKIDQSLAHDGVCLTVVAIDAESYTVTAIKETLEKTNLKGWAEGGTVNLERAMKLGDRLDGHIVQGHVDQTGICVSVEEAGGSWYFTFEYEAGPGNITIEKGSICVNGVSLTVVNSQDNRFSVAIIPYTFEHTNFNAIKAGTTVNLEFDVVGKYVARLHALRA
ncbi:riboflavin synthase subunit alpha [Flavobacterium akiainvivens]|uniref:Riboflavin synthase n=1 Tax=Flavobacterium akiainvivens TaxID=1202724 RepID=A0A0M8MAZ9_9FLAO|nr:riboflavin synthase [Flavobacterium akiainvivens]KOS07333.1 riboflavin synthase subunit alpha [Flavobacterium akiainvivens]SFQ46791.1 riboflavin synthase alpha chain [Flavobacterium akiainvivens]